MEKVLLRHARALVPPLGSARAGYKGQAGKIGVLGGCAEYTGAPYFAAASALRAGADLSHVFTTHQAAQVIKTYSPELIVHPYLFESATVIDDNDRASTSGRRELADRAVERVSEWLPKLSCLVVGPGLGRDPLVLLQAELVMAKALEMRVPLVVDADGLWIWSNSDTFDAEPFKPKSQAVVLTPNAVELRRLERRYGENLCASLGGEVVVVEKGAMDRVCAGDGPPVVVSEGGSPRRCGGQGDVLAGCIGTFLSWAAAGAAGSSGEGEDSEAAEISRDAKVASAFAGSLLTREASRAAFEDRGRSMVCGDVVEEVGPAFSRLFEARLN